MATRRGIGAGIVNARTVWAPRLEYRNDCHMAQDSQPRPQAPGSCFYSETLSDDLELCKENRVAPWILTFDIDNIDIDLMGRIKSFFFLVPI